MLVLLLLEHVFHRCWWSSWLQTSKETQVTLSFPVMLNFPSPLSLFSSLSDKTQALPQKTLASSLTNPHTDRKRGNNIIERIRLTTSFLRWLWLQQTPKANEDVCPQRQKKRKGGKKTTLYSWWYYSQWQSKSRHLENQRAPPKQGVYPKHHNIFINVELSYSN